VVDSKSWELVIILALYDINTGHGWRLQSSSNNAETLLIRLSQYLVFQCDAISFSTFLWLLESLSE